MSFWREVWEGYKKRFWIIYVTIMVVGILAVIATVLEIIQ